MGLLVETTDALLLDLDGTIWEGGRAIAHAVEVLSSCDVPKRYITNNASRSAQDVATMLDAIGLPSSPKQVMTSAQAAVRLARAEYDAGTPVLVVGSESFKSLARDAGFVVVESADDNPQVVLQGHDPATGWAQLSEAALSLRKGAHYFASNTDTSLPSERGLLVGNGSMVAAVTSATGVRPRSAGKPEPTMFLQACEELQATRPLAVGDRLDTDIAGAVAAGIPALHVLTGVSGPLALIESPKEQRPDFIGDDMRALREQPEVLRPGPQGGFTARVDGDDIVLSRGGEESTPIEALRTVVDVAWHMPEPPELIRPASEAAERACEQWW